MARPELSNEVKELLRKKFGNERPTDEQIDEAMDIVAQRYARRARERAAEAMAPQVG